MGKLGLSIRSPAVGAPVSTSANGGVCQFSWDHPVVLQLPIAKTCSVFFLCFSIRTIQSCIVLVALQPRLYTHEQGKIIVMSWLDHWSFCHALIRALTISQRRSHISNHSTPGSAPQRDQNQAHCWAFLLMPVGIHQSFNNSRRNGMISTVFSMVATYQAVAAPSHKWLCHFRQFPVNMQQNRYQVVAMFTQWEINRE